MEHGLNNPIQEQEIGAPKQTIGSIIRMCIYGKEDVMVGSVCIKRTAIWELWRIFKYGIVGVLSLLIHIGLYHWMSRVSWQSGDRTLQYAIALSCSAMFNFTMHRLWTYSAGAFHFRMLAKYVGVIGSSMLMQSAVFQMCIGWFHLFDYFAFAISSIFAILFQYFSHRVFTFRK